MSNLVIYLLARKLTPRLFETVLTYFLQVQPQRSRPQALLFLSFLLMFIVLGINILIYFMAPMYALYGNQHYMEPDHVNGTVSTIEIAHPGVDASHRALMDPTTSPEVTTAPAVTTGAPSTTTAIPVAPFLEPRKCTTQAPAGVCILTRMGVFLNRYFFKTWFFGACYYWAVWVFCGTFVVGFLVSLFRPRKSAISGIVDSEDFEEDSANDDDELLVNHRSRRDGDDRLLRA